MIKNFGALLYEVSISHNFGHLSLPENDEEISIYIYISIQGESGFWAKHLPLISTSTTQVQK